MKKPMKKRTYKATVEYVVERLCKVLDSRGKIRRWWEDVPPPCEFSTLGQARACATQMMLGENERRIVKVTRQRVS